MINNTAKIQKVVFYLICAGLFLVLITPLLLNNKFLFPFISTKVFYFRILVEVILFLYIILALAVPKYRPDWRNPLFIAVSAFFGALTISSLFGVDLYKSFWGNIERGEGLLTLYHVYAYFVVLSSVFKDKKLWFWYINAAIAVSLIASGYGLAQDLGVEGVINTTGSRIASTIGNPAFFAGYLIFGIFASVILAIKVKINWARIIFILSALFQLFILFKTETRGSFLALVAALLIYIVLSMFLQKGSKVRRYSFVGFIGIIIILSGIWFFRDSQLIKSVPILRRITTISFDDITTQSRLLTWDSSWKGFKDRPFLGYGVENYNIAFNKYFHAEIFKDSGSQIWFDRAHNIIFDLLVTGGLLGFLLYFPMFILAFYVLYSYWRRTGDLQLALLVFVLLVAYFIQNLFVFDTLPLYINFYGLLAYILFLSREYKVFAAGKEDSSSQYDEKEATIPKLGNLGFVLYPVLVVFLVLSIYYFNVLPAKANKKAIYALSYATVARQYAKASELYQEAISMGTYQETEIRQKYAEFALDLLRGNKADREFIRSQIFKAAEYINANVKKHPYDVQHYLFLMMLYNQMSIYDVSYANKVLEFSKKALDLSPTRPQIYYEIGQAYLTLGQNEKGIEAFKKAIDLQPEARESWWNLAMAYAVINDVENSDKILEKLAEMGYDVFSPRNLKRFIPVYTSNKNIDKLIDLYTKLTEAERYNAEWWAKLAALYREKGDFDKAREAVNTAVDLDPSLRAQADKFLSTLNSDSENK